MLLIFQIQIKIIVASRILNDNESIRNDEIFQIICDFYRISYKQ